jgi:hypothetical protein
MKWFFALCNESKDCKRTIEHLKVAVTSARRHTNLEPYFLYDGKRDELTKWLTKRGVNVILTRVRPDLDRALAGNSKLENLGTARGAYLRVEVPSIAKGLKLPDKFILYTDCDVIFTKHSTDIFNNTPEYFSAAPEFKVDDYSYINTGVMLINVDNMQKTREKFLKHIKKQCKNPDATHAAYDQSMYNEFYNDLYDKLPPEYNWKPYWGYNPGAKIIHFHGPKIDTVRALEATKTPNILMYLYYTGQENNSGYTTYKNMFEDYSK